MPDLQMQPPQLQGQAQVTDARLKTGSPGLGIGGFVTSLVGLVLAFLPIVGLMFWSAFLVVVGLFMGPLLAIIGTALAGAGWAQASKRGASKGLSVAGVVLGGLAIVLNIIVWAIFSSHSS
jgi:hypothetical protein